MEFYIVGPAEGPVRIGIGDGAAAAEPGQEIMTFKAEGLKGGQGDIVRRLVLATLDAEHKGDGLIEAPIDRVQLVVRDAIQRVQNWEPPELHWPAIVKNLRTNVLRISVPVFAQIAGVASSTALRWETQGGSNFAPRASELARIRAFALHMGIPWDDRLLFEAPNKR